MYCLWYYYTFFNHAINFHGLQINRENVLLTTLLTPSQKKFDDDNNNHKFCNIYEHFPP